VAITVNVQRRRTVDAATRKEIRRHAVDKSIKAMPLDIMRNITKNIMDKNIKAIAT